MVVQIYNPSTRDAETGGPQGGVSLDYTGRLFLKTNKQKQKQKFYYKTSIFKSTKIIVFAVTDLEASSILDSYIVYQSKKVIVNVTQLGTLKGKIMTSMTRHALLVQKWHG